MTREAIEEALRAAIAAHVGAGKKLTDADGFVGRVLDALGLSDVTEYHGWTIRRVSGVELKLRGNARYRHGYVATKPGRTEQVAEPGGSHDAILSSFQHLLDTLDKIHDRYEAKGE